MQSRRIRIVVLAMAGLVLVSGGCAAIWRDVPSRTPTDPKVRLDAAWYTESPSPELIRQLTKQRQEHINSTIEQRKQGKAGLSLEEIFERGMPPSSAHEFAKSEVDANAQTHSSLVLNRQSSPSIDGGDTISVAAPEESGASTSASSKAGAGKIVIEVAGGERFVR